MHLGLGAFHRAHQAWYTDRADAGWGIAAFTGRSPTAAEALAAQDGLYVLVERAADGDTATVVQSIVQAHDGGDELAWRAAVADPAVTVLTLTVTEAGYAASATDDVAALRSGGGALTAPGRLVDGLRARRDAGVGPLAVVSCDNLPANGAVTERVVRGVARLVDPGLDDWIARNVSFVSTMVDRITPATTDDDRAVARALTGFADAVPVVTEPFSEWVLSGDFPAGRPPWERVGARFVADVEPYEQRKLWLLNAGHSLLAYRGRLLGHDTVDRGLRTARRRARGPLAGGASAPAPGAGGDRRRSRRPAHPLRQPADPALPGADRDRRVVQAPGPRRRAAAAAARGRPAARAGPAGCARCVGRLPGPVRPDR